MKAIRIHNSSVWMFLPLLSAVLGIVFASFFRNYGAQIFIKSLYLSLFICFLCLFFKKKFLFWISLFMLFVFLYAFHYLNSTVPGSRDIYQELPYKGVVFGSVLYDNRQLIVKTLNKGKIFVLWDDIVPPCGAFVKVCGIFEKPSQSYNPSAFNWCSYLAQRGIFSQCRAQSIKILSQNKISRIIYDLRYYVYSNILNYFPAREGSLLLGMLLGDINLVHKADLESLRRSGTMHIVAVSGLHVGIILYCLYILFRLFGFKLSISWISGLLLTYIYILVVGYRPSAIRAGIMLGMLVIGKIMGNRGNILNSLCLAAFILLTFIPGELFSSAFLLSFLAVFGIAYLLPLISDPHLKFFFVSVSSILAVYPVLAWEFFYVSLVAPIVNLIVVPMASLIVSGTLVLLLSSALSSTIAGLYAESVHLLLKFTMEVINYFAILPFSGVTIGRPSVGVIVLYYSLFLLLLIKRIVLKKFSIVLLSIVLLLYATVFKNVNNDFLAVACCGSEQVYVLHYDGKSAVILGKVNIDFKILRDFLYSRGLVSVRDVYIMHPVYDNMMPVVKLVKTFKVKNVYYSGVNGSEYYWEKFEKSTSTSKKKIAKKGKIFSYGKAYMHVLEPSKKYVDIRDNTVQTEFIGNKPVLFYTGGEIPPKKYYCIVAIEPYRADWQNLKKHSEKIIYTGFEKPAAGVMWIKRKGKILRL